MLRNSPLTNGGAGRISRRVSPRTAYFSVGPLGTEVAAVCSLLFSILGATQAV
jgi:hypothetical protein